MNIHRNKLKKRKSGFTLAELMVASMILVIVFVGMLLTSIKCLELNEMTKNSAVALAAAKSKMEQIKNTTFANIAANYNNVSFTPTGLTNAKGVSYVNSSVADLYVITVSVSWRQKNGRVVGEDTNLNGVINTGEDQNANGILDSPVEIITSIYNE